MSLTQLPLHNRQGGIRTAFRNIYPSLPPAGVNCFPLHCTGRLGHFVIAKTRTYFAIYQVHI